MAVTAETAKVVRERDRVCRWCLLGEYEPHPGPIWRFVIHHVKPKGIGGTSAPDRDHPDNLALVHDFCHRLKVHGRPREARRRGLLASRLGQVSPSALIARRPA